ncbi:MAG: hypothetical protein HY903_17585 [Deltaproteobacteria bacterium]|nr:hypothetical protein [Deltaproteobacteria bacterium]
MSKRSFSARSVSSLIAAASLAIAGFAGSGCNDSLGDQLTHVDDPLNEWATQNEDPTPANNVVPDAVIPDPDPTPQPEVCDGRDNDKDGEMDEGLDAGSCAGADGEAGIMKCIGGVMLCAVCEPGATRRQTCRCSTESVEVCGLDHSWITGPCDGCQEPIDVPCGFCGYLGADGACVNPGECEPGQSIYERCDSCPAGEDCSATSCIGHKLTCGNDCRWKEVEGCKARQPECSRDEMKTGECGECGDMTQRCDGCFWNNFGDCREHGACFVNAKQEVPCGSCGGHQVATATCNAQCEWAVSGCHGCEPGEPYTVSSGCQCGGTLIRQFQCQEKSAGECGLKVGEEVYLGVVQQCLPTICTPGQTGTDPVTGACRQCLGDCSWGACTGGPEEPPPPPPPPPVDCGCSGTRTVSCHDACGNSRTDTCVNCQWQTGTCPPCTH